MSTRDDFVDCVADGILEESQKASKRSVFRFGSNILIDKNRVINILNDMQTNMLYNGYTGVTSSLTNRFAYEVMNEVLQEFVDSCVKNKG